MRAVNYRHIYHAGNPCDVVKHAIFARLVASLRAKDKAFAVLDTHAGCGVYNLGDSRALKTNEAQNGARRLWDARDALSADLEPYLNVVRAFNPGAGLSVYPGSPAIARHLLRAQDRLIVCEKHPEDAESLRLFFTGDRQAHVHARDGYEALKAFLPFPEKRGLVLIDPPFEEPDEFTRLAKAIQMVHERMPGALGAFWYPVKERHAIERFHETLNALKMPELIVAEFMFFAEEKADRLNGSGFVFLNAPWKWSEALEELFSTLRDVLDAPLDGARIERLGRQNA